MSSAGAAPTLSTSPVFDEASIDALILITVSRAVVAQAWAHINRFCCGPRAETAENSGGWRSRGKPSPLPALIPQERPRLSSIELLWQGFLLTSVAALQVLVVQLQALLERLGDDRRAVCIRVNVLDTWSQRVSNRTEMKSSRRELPGRMQRYVMQSTAAEIE